MAQNYDINYDDKRFAEVEADKNAALNEVDVTYGNMISNSDKYFQSQIDASREWADKQSQLQQEKTDFAIEKIEQDKAQAKKDYTKEQSGAYVDWRKQSNEYGSEAEKMASAGLQNTGYSESSQVSMYNTYQNRVTAARESYNQAVLSYNNAITEAKLQNNSVLAEIAYEALQKELELSLQGFQYKNQLILEKANKKTQLNSEYYARYQDVLKQINTENALAEEVRQYNASLAQQQAQLAEQKRQFDAQMAEEKRQFDATHSGPSDSPEKKIDKKSSKKTNSQVYKEAKDEHIAQKKYEAQKKNQQSKGGSDNSATLQSILALGYGPISGAKLNNLVASGEVVEYYENGVQKFRKAFPKKGIGNKF
jgi:hypothetical protein